MRVVVDFAFLNDNYFIYGPLTADDQQIHDFLYKD